jgi:hypothetical protein
MAPFSEYARYSWSVQGMDGKRRRFALNVPQRIIDWEVDELIRQGKPVLVDILKARRQGSSTYCCARMQHRVQTTLGYQALSMADKADLPRQWLRRGQAWYNEQKPDERPEIQASNAVEMYFSDIQSRWFISSAEGKTPGMGDGLGGLHVSEVENFLSPAKMFADLQPSIELTNPATLAFRESTGEMEGSYWHEIVLADLRGDSEWKLIFLPWFISPEYARPTKLTPADYTPEERLLVEQADQWIEANLSHAAIAGFRGIRPEQVEWRRYIIRAFFNGSVEMFACRYPATIQEAFMSVGSLALPASIVKHHKATARQPLACFTLEQATDGTVRAVPYEPGLLIDVQGRPLTDSLPYWRMYEPHDPGSEYAMGADVAEGIVSDPSDERSERDYSAIGVLNRRTLATAALFHGRVEPDKLGQEMLKAGKFWNEAWMAPEVNSAGMAVLTEIRSYPRVMFRDGPPDLTIDPSARPLERLGWRTGPTTRDLLIDEYVRDCRAEGPGGFDGKLRCLCPDLAREEGTFIRTKTGKREHRPGRHDDVLFAFMIALQVHRACPHERQPVGEDATFEEFDREDALAEAEAEGLPAWVINGGRDPGVKRGEEDEDDE